MENGKFANSKGMNVKILALVLTMVTLIGSATAGTLAWLTDKTQEVKNTFTVGNIDITLKEDTTDYKMVPGFVINKDPEVAVVDGSEDCWLFVKVTESITPDLDAYIAYAFAAGWETVVPENTNGEIIIGRKVMAADATKSFSVLGAGSYTDSMGTDDKADDFTIAWGIDQVGVKPSVTKPMMEAIENGNKPTLTFKAYAVQLWKTTKPAAGATDAEIAAAQFTAEQAWAQASTQG